jgi:2-polyprenyl-6-methoxyphenol hydroxylase-like FAD-dependent oxidoreductase
VAELGVPIYRGCEVTGFAQDDSGVDVELADGRSLHAQYLVGCDGGRSIVRRRAGIDFAGWDASVSYLIAEAQMTGAPDKDIRHGANGINAIGKMEDGKRTRVVLIEPNEPSARRSVEPSAGDTVEPQHRHAVEPKIDDLRAALVAVYGSDFGVRDVTWLSRFSDMARQAVRYRERRVLLAGDAAHVHAPTGGQGLNIGVQDAVNLGWKLAQVVRGVSPPGLLDTYHAERHPIAARVLKLTLAQVALMRGDERTMALREDVAALLAIDEARKRYGALMSGLDVRYDLGRADSAAQHPLLGRRMPDLDVMTENGTLRVFTLLREARPVLLNFGEPMRFDIAPWAGRVQLVDARFAGSWKLPVLGEVTAPGAALIRPDGYVAWVGDESSAGAADALTTWFGQPL